MHSSSPRVENGNALIRGARCVFGPALSDYCFLRIDSGRISRIAGRASVPTDSQAEYVDIDLSGFLVFPGLVNAHDHLQFALYPRLGGPHYKNYFEWGEDVHQRFSDVIATHHRVPKKTRVWWGGIRNLLCGATTVCHHDQLWPELQRQDFPIRVVQHYGWAHSLALGGDILQAWRETPYGSPFILHVCEGVDNYAKQELSKLDQLGILNKDTVLVHGLAVDESGIELLRRRGVSLVTCPSSNNFLFGRLPSMDLLGEIDNLSLGNDSPLTSAGDLLDEIRFGTQHCKIPPERAYAMVTDAPAAVLRLSEKQGTIRESGIGDLIGVRDTGVTPADTLQSLSIKDVEFVMVAGVVQLASDVVRKALSASAVIGLEPLWIDGILRWIRAPIQELLCQAEAVLGVGQVHLGGRELSSASNLIRES